MEANPAALFLAFFCGLWGIMQILIALSPYFPSIHTTPPFAGFMVILGGLVFAFVMLVHIAIGFMRGRH